MTELIIAVVVIRARTSVPQCIVRQMHAQCNSIWAEMIKWSALRNDYNARLFFPCQSLARVALFLFIITVFSMRDWGVVLRKCQCNLLLIVQDMYARLHSVFFSSLALSVFGFAFAFQAGVHFCVGDCFLFYSFFRHANTDSFLVTKYFNQT